MINFERIPEKPNLQEEFAYRQIGSITRQIDPVDVSSSLEFVLEFFKNNPELVALPIERNGILTGILDRSVVEKMNESAWNRFWQKDLDAYIEEPMLFLRADDYIEKNILRTQQLNHDKGVRFFSVYYRKNFFGIVGLNDLHMRMNELRSHDMAKARQIQQHLLDTDLEEIDDRYTVLTLNKMANEVGGDFFKDFCLSDGDRHIIGCFDVSGKNVAASLSTMAIGSVFAALKNFPIGDLFGEEITLLMDKFIDDLTPTEMFVTAAICYVDLKEKTLFIQNCGHTPIYIFIPGDNGQITGRTMNPNLPPLGMGILKEEENGGYRLPITKGLRIVLYTDGLTDMVTPEGTRYNDERTRSLFASAHGKKEVETSALYEKAIDNWIMDAMLADDITIMDIRFH